MNRRTFVSKSLLGCAAVSSVALDTLRATPNPLAESAPSDASLPQAQGKLFPTSLPERQWVEFSAEGFGQTAVGVIFRKGGNGECGVPLGGIGTGYISLSLDGCLGEWTIFNDLVNPSHARKMFYIREPVPAPRRLDKPFLGVAVKGKTCLLTLGKPEQLNHPSEIHYWGHYPVADLEYELDLPISVGLRAWAPLVPGDAALSNTPGAVFEVRLQNTAASETRGTIAFSFPGPAEYETVGTAEFQRQSASGGFQGIAVSSIRPGWPMFIPPSPSFNPEGPAWPPEKPFRPYEYVLGVIGQEKIRTGGALSVENGSWPAISSSLPDAGPQDPGETVAVDFSLKAGEAKIVRFVLTWYAPYWPATPYINMYRLRFNSALEVARLLAAEHPAILSRVLHWQQAIYSESRLPNYLRESLVNILCLMCKGSSYVCRPGASAANGLLAIAEAAGFVPLRETGGVSWWGDFPVTFFFPDLRRNTLRAFAAYQTPEGQIPFILGEGDCSLDAPHYTQQYIMNSMLYVQQVDRLYARTRDENLLREFYPSIERAISYTMTLSAYQDGLVALSPDYPNAQPWDGWNWFGDAIYLAGHWLASLQVGARMAAVVGDREFGSLCQEWVVRGRQTMEKLLWNAKDSSYFMCATPGDHSRTNNTIFPYQLDGTFHHRAVGTGEEVFPAQRTDTVLDTIYRVCVKPVPAGAVNGASPDGTIPKPEVGGQRGAVWVQANAILAAIYAYDGRVEIAKELVRKGLSNLVLTHQLSWNFPQAFDDIQGQRPFLGNYYWGMALWAIPPSLLGHPFSNFARLEASRTEF